MNYIYFGTSKFAAIILEKLIASAMTPVAVVTQPDRPAGRSKKLQEPPVKKVAEKHAIPLLQPERLTTDNLQLTTLRPDVCVVAAYGRIIPKEILDIPKYGFLNVHPSLLPLYRGPSPIQTAILNGDTETGVSIMLLDEEVDHGPVLVNYELRIKNYVTAPELEKKLAERGTELLIKTIPQWIEGKIEPMPQDHAKATFTKMMTKDDGRIDWKQSAEQIERHVRAMQPWPGSWTVWKNKQKKMLVHLKKVSMVKEGSRQGSNNTVSTGKIIGLSGDAMLVVCGKDMLAIHELQPEGKKEMTARAFANGHCGIIGSIFS